MKFSKYVGCGNDFIMVDNRDQTFKRHHSAQIATLCHRQLGIGADGVVLLENSSKSDFKMRIFNADGSEAEMCGNGIRCLFKFIKQLGIAGESFIIETMQSFVKVESHEGDVKVAMPKPCDLAWNMNLSVEATKINVHFLNTGVPHAVIMTDSIDSADLVNQAPKIRHHPQFSPKGTNVNYAMICPSGVVHVRTYERGVEQETLACGTGATAAALAAAKLYGLKGPISVKTKAGELLQIDFQIESDNLDNVTMTGPAKFVFQGEWVGDT